ncbi:MAG: RHS repeat-associated core domain-containing protein, partial [Planctomycetaceae bacterium]
DLLKILTETAYDENRNVTGTTNKRITHPGQSGETTVTVWSTSTEYDANGQVIRSTDQYGNVSENLYDTRGRLIESRNITRNPDGSTAVLLSRTVYDAAGRAVVTTNTYKEGTAEPITGSRTTYDAAGRVVQTESLTGVEIVITIDGNANDFVSAIATVGSVFAARGTTFDTAGRVTATTDQYGNVTQTTYNDAGDVIQTRSESKDENGDIAFLLSQTVYDEYGRAVVSTDRYLEDGEDPVLGTRTIYDDKGRVVRSERLTGVIIEIEDGDTEIVDYGTVLYATQTVYDSKGRVAKNIAADGQTTTYEYDSLNRRIATIAHAVDPASVGLIPPTGAVSVALRTETVYDDQGRVEAERTNIAQFFNAAGVTVSIDASAVRETSYEYDIYGQVVKTTFADGNFISMAYDDVGRTVAETNQLGLTRTFDYDHQGRLVAVELPAVVDPSNGNVLVRPRYEYEFDALGNQTSIRDPLGRETRFTFDDRGQQLSRTLPLGIGTEDDFTERMEYDIFGRQVLAITFEGKVIRFVYDEGTETEKGTGRLLAKEFFDNQTAYDNDDPAETIEYSYDVFGRLVAVDDERGETTYEYDERGNLVRTVSPEGTINYAYDDLGRKIRTFTDDGDVEDPLNDFAYEYDALGRLAKVTIVERNDVVLTEQEQTAYAYDLQGNLDLQTNPNGVITDYSYDDLNRLTDLVHYLPDETPETLADNDKLAEFEYEVREDGRRTSATETFWFDSAAHVNTITWTYDNAGRLIDEVFDHYDDQYDQTQHFTYDLVGNRLMRTVDEGNDSSIDQVFASLYDANDRLLTEEADLDNDSVVDQTTTYGYTGTQQTQKTVTEGSQTTSTTNYEYNLDGRLKTVTITGYTSGSPSRVEKTTYGYDHTGIRVSTLFQVDADVNESFEEQTKTTYLIDQHNFTGYQQVLEATVTNVVTSDLIKKVVYTIGHDQIAQTTFTPAGDPEGETLVFHMDGHGSTRVVTDLVATILQIFAYDAFGVAIGFDVAQALTEYLYNNEQFDHRIAMQYLRRRFYDPAIGRFPQLDEFTGNNRDPQSYHKYLYTHADPVNGWDPTGMS